MMFSEAYLVAHILVDLVFVKVSLQRVAAQNLSTK